MGLRRAPCPRWRSGFPFTCVSIGLTVEKELVLGVVYNPLMGALALDSPEITAPGLGLRLVLTARSTCPIVQVSSSLAAVPVGRS